MRAGKLVRAPACGLEEFTGVGNHRHFLAPHIASPNAADRIYPSQCSAKIRASSAHGDVQAVGGVLAFDSRIKKLDETVARCHDVSMQGEVLNKASSAHGWRAAFPMVTN